MSKNRFDEAIRFKNGNIHVRWFNENIEDCKAGKFSDIELLTMSLEKVDTYIIGDQMCFSNFSMGCMLYNYYNDCIYLLDFNDLDRLLNGKTLILHAIHQIDTETRDIINNS